MGIMTGLKGMMFTKNSKRVSDAQTWDAGLLDANIRSCIRLASIFLLLTFSVQAQEIPLQVRWRVIARDADHPTTDEIVAAVSLLDPGFENPLPANPATTDCTATFQEALDLVKTAGGGTVFVPKGHYKIAGNLTIADHVTLRGRWREITSGRPASGTVLKLYPSGSLATLTISGKSAGLRDLTFWHPEQTPDNVDVNTPFVIRGLAHVMTLENITFINAVNGIDSSKSSYCCFRGLYGSPLQVGLTADQSASVSRFDSIHFSPDYWTWSGLAGSPAANGPHAGYMRANGLAVNIKEMDGFYFQNSSISGYHTGLYYQIGVSGDDPHGDMSYLTIRDCTYALRVGGAKHFKVLGCTFSGTTYGIFNECNVDMLINASLIEGGTHAIHAVDGGHLNLVNCTLSGSESMSLSGSIVKNTYDTVIPSFSFDYDSDRRPAETKLFNVKEYGAQGDRTTDDTQAFLDTIAAAKANGGGIVFLPSGIYGINGYLDLGTGIELRGIAGGRQQADSDDQTGSLILIKNQGGSETGTPFITLGDHSGLRGVSFHYMDQNIYTFVKHPYMIQGRGIKNYIIDCFATNPYRGAEFNGDDHLVEYTFFGGIRNTYRANNCSGGRIQNCHIKPDFWRNIEIGSYPHQLHEIHALKWRITQQLEIFDLNGCDDYSISSIFNHASHNFMTVNNSSGQALMISAEQVQKGYLLESGSKTFEFLNSSCNINHIGDYSGTFGIKTETEFTGRANYYTSSLWGTQDQTWDASGGKLYMQQCRVGGFSNRGAMNFRCHEGGDIEVESGDTDVLFGWENDGLFSMKNFDFRKGCLFAATERYKHDNLLFKTYILADLNQEPPLDYGIVLDTSNIVMEDALMFADQTDIELRNADGRRVKAARLVNGGYSLDVTEPAFSDGNRLGVAIEAQFVVDGVCTIEIWYHSTIGMKMGKSQDYDGSVVGSWAKLNFNVRDAKFGSADDIRIDVIGDSPQLVMVAVRSLVLSSNHQGKVVLDNNDSSATVDKSWEVSNLNQTNPTVTGSAATATGSVTAAGTLESFDTFSLMASSVIGWTNADANAAIADGRLDIYLAGLAPGRVAGTAAGELGADSSSVNTGDGPHSLGLGSSEALVYSVDTSNLSSANLYLLDVTFQGHSAGDRLDFLIFDSSRNVLVERQWDAVFAASGAISGSWELENGDLVIIAPGSTNGTDVFSVDKFAFDLFAKDNEPPAVPIGLTATPSAGRVVLDWMNNQEPDLRAYHVYRADDGGDTYVEIADSIGSDYADTDVEDGIVYYYAVTAVDDEGNESERSDIASAILVTTHENVAPLVSFVLPVIDLKDQEVNSSVTVEAHGSDVDGSVESYELSVSKDGAVVATSTSATGTFSAVALYEPGIFAFQLVAIDNDGALSTVATRTVSVKEDIVTPPVVGSGGDMDSDDGGCGCSSSEGSSGIVWLIVLGILALTTGRRYQQLS